MDSQHTLSRELALRIGLVTRALPDTDAKSLFTVLTTTVGLPLTEDKLSKLDLPTLKAACDIQQAALDETVLARALFILKQATAQTAINTLAPQLYAEGDMPGSLRIACASNNGVQVDGHFGSCTQFMVYQVSASDARLIAVRDAELAEGLVVADKNSCRAELIQDCQVVYIASVGGPAAAKVIKLGIHPIKLTEIQVITEVIQQLQTVLAGTPPPWLAKAMGIAVPHRFRFDSEQEQEATG